MKKILLICLDGFTWKVADRLIEKGVMPTLGKLVQSGGSGTLKSTIPFETAPAWSAFQTGCQPNKTGIYAFHKYDRAKKKMGINSLNDNPMPTLWEILSLNDKKIVSLNMPVSSPPPSVNGVIVPGLLCPKLSSETVFPPNVYDEIIKPRKDYKIVNNEHKEIFQELTLDAIKTEQTRSEVALELMEKYPWDVFAVQLQSSDLVQHRMWSALDETSEDYDEANEKVVSKFYKCCDQIINDLIQKAGDDCLKIVVSDHGFCKSKGSVGINVWLRKKGYLVLKPINEETGLIKKFKEGLKRKFSFIKKSAQLYGKICKTYFSKPLPPFAVIDYKNMMQIVDFENTSAVCIGGMCGLIYICGDQAERKLLAEKIRGEILKDLGPESEINAVNSVKYGSDVYGESNKDGNPDLVVFYQEGYENRREPSSDNVIRAGKYQGKDNGTHDINGIFVFNGDGIISSTGGVASIVDVSPTVLSYFGVPIPEHMDGKVLKSLFKEDLGDTHVNMQPTERDASSGISDEEQDEVEKKLSDLGYL